MPLAFRNLFSIHKLDYIKNRKPTEGCILCCVARGETGDENLSVAAGPLAVVCVNKFPYNSGHILIFPKRHVTDYRALSGEEENEVNLLLRRSLDVLDALYEPSGYNVGYNIGDFAGASIAHLHMHVIPRYRNELGFVDIVGGAKIVVENPSETMRRLKDEFEKRDRRETV
jgi:ATP adenylyltransferase